MYVVFVFLVISLLSQKFTLIFVFSAKLQKQEKPPPEEQDKHFFIQNKKLIRSSVVVTTVIIFVTIVIVSVTLLKPNPNSDTYDIPPIHNAENLGSHQVLTRIEWNGRPARGYQNITPPVGMVIIKHTGGGICKEFQVCAGKVQTIQGTSIAEGKPDIYCNFLIGGDGNIYVGRGWDVRNEQRDSTIDVVFMGNFDIDEFTQTMGEAALLLIEDGLKKNKLAANFKIICHNQTANLRSPGQNVFNEVVKWPHYDRGLYFPNRLVSWKCLSN